MPILKAENMNINNQDRLLQVKEMISSFERQPRLDSTYDLLNKAAQQLEQIDFYSEHEIKEFQKIRHNWLVSSLKIIQLLDQYYQPNFSPEKPYILPSFAQTGKSENELKENEKIRIEIFLQQKLVELDSSEEGYDIKYGFPFIVKETIKKIYSYNNKDQEELRVAIDRYIVDPKRKNDFSKILLNSHK